VFLQSCSELCGVRAVSRYKDYRSHEIITGYKIGCEHRSSIAVQRITEPEIYHGAGLKLRVAARIRVQVRYKFIQMQGQGKNHDKLIYFTSVVSCSLFSILLIILRFDL
jgi:hypothetical protein